MMCLNPVDAIYQKIIHGTDHGLDALLGNVEELKINS